MYKQIRGGKATGSPSVAPCDERRKIINRLKSIAGATFVSPRGRKGRITEVGLQSVDTEAIVPYDGAGDHPGMTLEQLQEVVRGDERFITYRKESPPMDRKALQAEFKRLLVSFGQKPAASILEPSRPLPEAPGPEAYSPDEAPPDWVEEVF